MPESAERRFALDFISDNYRIIGMITRIVMSKNIIFFFFYNKYSHIFCQVLIIQQNQHTSESVFTNAFLNNCILK